MKVYIISHALTTGIKEIEGEISNTFPGMFISKHNNEIIFKHRWYANLDEAKVASEKKKQKRIADLKKQIDKLEKISFIW